MREVLDNISYKPGYSFELREERMLGQHGRIHMLRVVLYAACSVTGQEDWQMGRWFVVEHPTDEHEVVRTAYQALHLFELHEFQENFKYNGKPVFDPHVMNL